MVGLRSSDFLVYYACQDEPGYDGLDFATYPIRRGWTTSDDPYGWCLSSKDLCDLTARAQSWLYFGLLEAWLWKKIAQKASLITLAIVEMARPVLLRIFPILSLVIRLFPTLSVDYSFSHVLSAD
ncbi:hypothetical protein F5Y19DRAFT_194149 [Xylariaceae sp. FL1651]|nr:hypothetical protein F5Y19DRAFT_194149 [Xylariaceae sp. FL1651]